MKNLNGNLLCAIDVETTGRDPLIHSILDIAIIPLDDLCNPSKKHKIFNVQMKPKPGAPVEYEALQAQYKDGAKYAGDPGDQHSHKITIERQFLTDCIHNGVEQDNAADMMYHWFQDLGLGLKKRIVPLAHNWPFDRGFISDWLGDLSFDLMMDARFRDTMTVSNFENDLADFRGTPFPYPKNRLKELAHRHHLEKMVAHRALDDAFQTARVYKAMIQSGSISTRLVLPDDITFRCATCGSLQIKKIINTRPYCADHMAPDVVVERR